MVFRCFHRRKKFYERNWTFIFVLFLTSEQIVIHMFVGKISWSLLLVSISLPGHFFLHRKLFLGELALAFFLKAITTSIRFQTLGKSLSSPIFQIFFFETSFTYCINENDLGWLLIWISGIGWFWNQFNINKKFWKYKSHFVWK